MRRSTISSLPILMIILANLTTLGHVFTVVRRTLRQEQEQVFGTSQGFTNMQQVRKELWHKWIFCFQFLIYDWHVARNSETSTPSHITYPRTCNLETNSSHNVHNK